MKTEFGIITMYCEHETMPYGERLYPHFVGTFIYDKHKFPNLSAEVLEKERESFIEWYRSAWEDYWRQENGSSRFTPEKDQEFKNVIEGQYGYSDLKSYLMNRFSLDEVTSHFALKLPNS